MQAFESGSKNTFWNALSKDFSILEINIHIWKEARFHCLGVIFPNHTARFQGITFPQFLPNRFPISPFESLADHAYFPRDKFPIEVLNALFENFSKNRKAQRNSPIHISWNWNSYQFTDGRKPIIKRSKCDHFFTSCFHFSWGQLTQHLELESTLNKTKRALVMPLAHGKGFRTFKKIKINPPVIRLGPLSEVITIM